MTVTTSVDGATYAPLPGAPELLQIRTECPPSSEVFELAAGAEGRYVRVAIGSSYADGAVTNVGLGCE